MDCWVSFAPADLGHGWGNHCTCSLRLWKRHNSRIGQMSWWSLVVQIRRLGSHPPRLNCELRAPCWMWICVYRHKYFFVAYKCIYDIYIFTYRWLYYEYDHLYFVYTVILCIEEDQIIYVSLSINDLIEFGQELGYSHGVKLGIEMFFSWSHGHDLHSRKKIKKETRKLKIYTYTVGWHLWGDSLCIWIAQSPKHAWSLRRRSTKQRLSWGGCWIYPLPLASLWNVGFWWLDCFDDGWLNSEIRISTYFERDTFDFISFLIDYQSFRVLSISLVLCPYSWMLFIALVVALSLAHHHGTWKRWITSSVGPLRKLARTSHILRPSSWILTLQLWRCYTITVTISFLNLLGAPSQFVWKPLVGSKRSLGSTAPLQYRMYRCCGLMDM